MGIKGKGWGEKEFPYLKFLLNLLCAYTFIGSFLLQDSLLAFQGKTFDIPEHVLCTHIWHKLVQPFASYHDITDITSSYSFFQTAIALLRVSYTFVLHTQLKQL